MAGTTKSTKKASEIRFVKRIAKRSGALVLFGVTGYLAYKMNFPAFYAMAKRGALKVPVVGVAYSHWSLAQVRKRAKGSLKEAGKIDDPDALDHLLCPTSGAMQS